MVANTHSEPIPSPGPAAASDEERPEPTAGTMRRRRQKILEYLADADAKASPLEANIAIINGDLMTLLGEFLEDHQQIRANEPDPMERLYWLAPLNDQVFKLTRQIYVFTNVALRLQKERQQAQPPENQLLLAADAQVTSFAGPVGELPVKSDAQGPIVPSD